MLLQDYVRLFGAKCDKCHLPFSKEDYVMRAQKKIFHLNCFKCVACGKQFTDLEADQLFDPAPCRESSGVYHWSIRLPYLTLIHRSQVHSLRRQWQCSVEEDEAAMPKKDSRLLLAKFNERMERSSTICCG